MHARVSPWRRKWVAVAAALVLGRGGAHRARAPAGCAVLRTRNARPSFILGLLLNHHAAHATLSRGLHLICLCVRRAARPFRHPSRLLFGVRVASAPRGVAPHGLRSLAL